MFTEFRQNAKLLAKEKNLTYAKIAEQAGVEECTIRACSHKKSIKNHSKKNNRNENRIKFIITSENFSEAF